LVFLENLFNLVKDSKYHKMKKTIKIPLTEDEYYSINKTMGLKILNEFDRAIWEATDEEKQQKFYKKLLKLGESKILEEYEKFMTKHGAKNSNRR